jgi:beta-lactamase regulating signal transducer with metallopeptidase domain
MTPLALIPFLASVLLALHGERLGRALPPATAVRVLTAAALACALGVGFVLAAGAFTVLAEIPFLANTGRWSVSVLRGDDPVPALLGLVPAIAVSAFLARALHRGAQHLQDLAAAHVTCRRLGPAASGLIIVPDEAPQAYTLPGLSGRIVVSTGMLKALSGDERRVLLAHEDSHLRHRHHAYLQLSDLAATANPLLRPSARAVRLGVERWADEDAAQHTGDRPLVARALARAALALPPPTAADPRLALGAVRSAVTQRVRALLGPPPPRRPLTTIAVTVLIAAVLCAVLGTEKATEHRFEQARHAYDLTASGA